MAERRPSKDFGILFCPERWTSHTKFRSLMGPPFLVNRELHKAVGAIGNHLEKFKVLAGLANRLKERLAEDMAELEATGHTPANRSREFAALTESLFCELYAALDGVRQTLHSVFAKVRGVQNQSTEKLFKRASENTYGPEFPNEIRDALASAYTSWFPRLRIIRTEVTHGDIGNCHVNKETQKIFYMHSGLGTATKALVIEDVVEELNEKRQSVVELVELVFAYLYAKLEPVNKTVFCGIYMGRMYQREVAPTADINFNSGTCVSRKWFENEAGLECPLRHDCGAFHRSIDEERVSSARSDVVDRDKS